jgi:hypothetical protein
MFRSEAPSSSESIIVKDRDLLRPIFDTRETWVCAYCVVIVEVILHKIV